MRIGIIGAGLMAAEHVATLRRLDDVEVIAVCDVDPGRAKQLADGAATYTQWTELLSNERPDAVFVCTPPLTHREVAVPALEQGIHVYLEKPIARGLLDAQAIVAAASRSRSVCAIGYQWRGIDVLDDLREAVEGQELGLLVGINAGPAKSRPWFLDRSQGGGNLLERASHHIDLQRALGGEVVAVQAAASAVLLAQSQGERGDIDDAAALLLHFANGGLGSIQVAWTRDGLPEKYALDVLATDAVLHLELDPEFRLTGRSAGRQVEATSRQDPRERSIARFIEAARERNPGRVFCSPPAALGTLAVALACEAALSSGGTVPLTTS